MAAYNTNDLARIYRKARGVGENALSMLTSGFAEPAAGYAAAAAAATGYDAEGARNAIRERMTYAPKTAEGIQYMNALARVMSAVNDSAPVTTWKKGVDIAGRYSPTAGAVLASVPTAIGVATGAKSALQQGRSASMLAQRMQEGMVRNAMAPRTLHPQAGVIDMLTTKPGQLVRDTKTGEIYEYQGPSTSISGKALVVDESIAKRITDAQKKAAHGYSIDPERLDVYNKRTKKTSANPKGEDSVRLYHGSYYEWPEDAQIGLGSGDRFGGIFTSYGGVEPAYSGFNYYIDIPESKILTKQTLGYHVPADKQLKALEKVTGVKRGDPRFQAYVDAIIDEQGQSMWTDDSGKAIPGSFQDVHKIKGLSSGLDSADYGWEAQRLRGQLAKELGYDAVEMTDETGTSVLVVKKDKMSRLK